MPITRREILGAAATSAAALALPRFLSADDDLSDYVIESSNPKVSGYDGAVRSFVDYLYELAEIR